MENTIVHLATKDLSGKYQYANPAFIQPMALGIRKQGRTTSSYRNPLPVLLDHDLEAMRTGKVNGCTGVPNKILAVHQVLRDEIGRPNLIINESEDITEWKAADSN